MVGRSKLWFMIPNQQSLPFAKHGISRAHNFRYSIAQQTRTKTLTRRLCQSYPHDVLMSFSYFIRLFCLQYWEILDLSLKPWTRG